MTLRSHASFYRLAFCLILPGLTAGAAAPDFDPRSLRPRVAGPLTEVLVLGTAHLSGLKDLKGESLEPLLARLAAFRPDLITIEALSGESLFQLEAYADLYPDVAASYGKRLLPVARLAETASGLTRPRAAKQVRTTLGAWPAAPTAAQRRQLCLWLAAAGDATSATVQWMRLPPAERIAADGLTPEITGLLEAKLTEANENVLLAARLAARLGLERVYPVDDHSADDAGEDMPAALVKAAGEAVGAADGKTGRAYSQAYRARVAGLSDGKTDMLDLFRFLNDPQNQRLDAEEQWLCMLTDGSKDHLARVYVGWWETRNLRMVANIREAITNVPGKRVLVIVGASHKPYLDAYLDLMHEVRVVDAAAILQ